MSSAPPPPPPEGDLNKGVGIIASTAVLVGVSTIVIAMRMSTRIWITKSLWWDDWTILLALLGNIIGAALDFVEVHYGLGRPEAYLSKWQIIEFRKYTYGEWIQTFATLMWTKVSICFFLLRIPVSKILIRPLQIAIVLLILSNIILTVLWIVQCRPLSGAWNPDVDASCFGRGQLERIIISQAAISVISDFLFSAYPILIFWNVQMALGHKVALCCLMGVGVITGACCIVRTVLNFQAVPLDLTYGGIPNWFWRLFEINLGLIAACTPALLPWFNWIKDKYRKSNLSRSHTHITDELRLTPAKSSLKTSRAHYENTTGSSNSDDMLFHVV